MTAAYTPRHSTLCALNSTGHRGPCTCGVVESDREANRPGDATNAPGHDTEEVTSMPDQPNADLWYGRAERLLDAALDAIREERIDDSLSNASLAVACMHVPDGTQDASEFDGYSWPGEPEDESDCICTPEQRESGGFMGRCPVHGYGNRIEVRRANA